MKNNAATNKRFVDVVLRLFDVAASAVGLVLLVPLFLVVGLAIRLGTPGPILFRHRRIGRGFKAFDVLKFRTMVENAQALGGELTVGGDDRVTRVGRVLRRTKIDELPQLLNVLVGDMSLVGPRPEVRRYVEEFHSDYEAILTIRPGITDLASVRYRDEAALLAESDDPHQTYVTSILPEKLSLARHYLENRSVRLYFTVIFETLFAIIGRRRHSGSAAGRMPERDLRRSGGEKNATTN